MYHDHNLTDQFHHREPEVGGSNPPVERHARQVQNRHTFIVALHLPHRLPWHGLCIVNSAKETMMKNGKWAFKRTGRVYYARLRADGVWLYAGERPTYTNFCTVLPLDRFLVEYSKV